MREERQTFVECSSPATLLDRFQRQCEIAGTIVAQYLDESPGLAHVFVCLGLKRGGTTPCYEQLVDGEAARLRYLHQHTAPIDDRGGLRVFQQEVEITQRLRRGLEARNEHGTVGASRRGREQIDA